MSLLAQLKDKAINFFFLPQCIGCGRESNFLCFSCRRSLPLLLPPFCAKCGKPLPPEGFCLSCQGWQLEIDGIRSLYRFDGLIRHAIHLFKYNNLKALALPLGQLLAEYLQSRPFPKEVLVPVPLHSQRLRERGYNQSSLLAREVGKITSLPVIEDVLFRSRNSPAQARAKSAEERRSNVAGSFACKGKSLKNKQVLLIDDVCTTGATLDACAIALKEAGVKSVWGLTLAREI